MKDAEVSALLVQVKNTPSEDLESESVEFKGYRNEKALNNDSDLPVEVSALANHEGGGTIIVGVKDNSDVPQGQWEEQLAGVPSMDCTLVQERLKGRIDPAIPLAVREVTFEGKTYVVIEVPYRSDRLVGTRKGKYCVRDGRSSRPMTPPEVEAAVRALSSYDWSAEELVGDPQGFLDSTAVEVAAADFAQRREIPDGLAAADYLEAIGATRHGVLTHGGLLVLGSEQAIQAHLGDFEFRFSWKTKAGDLRKNDVWSGNLWNAVIRAKHHFDECNSWTKFTFEGRDFAVPLLDPVAFHEGFLNALVHRDYASPGMVAVTFGGDYMHITSPGGFFGGVSAANIARHEPRHRNRALAKILMNHHLVDRAGMGVLRMGLRSLRYGRAFPAFIESGDTVEVAMQAEYLRPPITVLTHDHENDWGIAELLIINSVYEQGYASVQEIEGQLLKVTANPWGAIERAVEAIDVVELCGTNDGVFIRVTPAAKTFMRVTKTFRVPTNSANHVSLFRYVRQHGEAQNADITPLLGYSHSSGTSEFLRKAKYVQRTGRGPGARWSLVRDRN